MRVKPTYEELERYGRQADITIENLEQKLAESQREFRAADATIENLQMQVEKLAAENAGLKAAVIERKSLSEEIRKAGRPPHTDFWHQSIYMADKKVDDALNSTPATDAFLAEVRAQESAPLVRALTVIANSEQHDGETVVCDFDTLISVAAGALKDHYAAQLRKGVQS